MSATGIFKLASRLLASQLLAGRWQIPLALVAAVTGGVTLYHLRPSPKPPDLDALLADVTVLEQAGDTDAAADLIAKLLDLNPPPPPEQRAALHNRLAELIYSAENERPVHNLGNVKKLLEAQRAADELGHPTSPSSALHAALAEQWLDQGDAALQHLRTVLNQELSSTDRRTAIRAMAQLLAQQPEAWQERQELLQALLTDEGAPAAYLWWGLQHAVQDALDGNDPARAREILERHGERLTNSDLKGYLDYLRACVLVHEGRPEEAEPIVNWVEEWLGSDVRPTRELDQFGNLRKLNRGLLGKIRLTENRPADALAAFEWVLQDRPPPELLTAATLGRALALSALGRHEAACGAFRSALAELSGETGHRRHAASEFKRTLLDLYERYRARQDYGDAFGYLALVCELTPADQEDQQFELWEKLALTGQDAARTTADAERSREYHAQAGRNLERAAELVPFDEPRLAELLWSAAEEYDRAGRTADLRRVLERFVQGRSEHPRLPRGLLQLGQVCETEGDREGARAWYARVIKEYPRLDEAARAELGCARILIGSGPEQYAGAERLLTGILTNDYLAPDAGVYRDALLTLCELLSQEGRYGEGIGRLEDFIALYPTDADWWRARFMLADAHRRSAYALRQSPPPDAAPEASAAESKVRFRSAAELFDRLLTDLEGAAPADESAELHKRLALFYRGDCLFELNDADTLPAALAAYTQAAARYEGQPAALTAYVQIANTHLRLGDARAAGRALERARWLLRGIPADAYGSPDSGARADWARFFDTVLSSDLFRDAFAAAQ